MPPLDTGAVAHSLRLVDPLNPRVELKPEDFPAVGAYLRAVRERHGHDLVEMAGITRISRSYLAAIEDAQYSALPSRPFAIGYVRAYANALDLDGLAMAERYKAEAPDDSGPLRAPIGVQHEKLERRPLILALAAVVILAVVGWNIIQHANAPDPDADPPSIPAAPAVEESPAISGPIALGAPRPAPAEQTTPAPYLTPGLQGAGDTISDPTKIAPPAPSAAPAKAPVAFTPDGAVYGVPAGGPAAVLQARKPASLIIRGPDGAVYFARQLKAGEAYRAPIGQKLAAEVADPSAFSLYVNGQLRGALLVAQTPLDKVMVDLIHSAPAE